MFLFSDYRHGLTGLGAQVGVDLVAHRLLVLLGDAEQPADDPHRHLGPEVGDEVELVGADEWVEAAGAELSDLGFERRHPVRREHPRHQSPVDGVHGRILEDEHTGRHLDVGPDQLEDAAPARDVGLRVEKATLDIVEPADGVEVVGLVVVERRLLPQPAEDRVRIGVDFDVVRVVVDVTGARDRHAMPPRCSASYLVGELLMSSPR